MRIERQKCELRSAMPTFLATTLTTNMLPAIILPAIAVTATVLGLTCVAPQAFAATDEVVYSEIFSADPHLRLITSPNVRGKCSVRWSDGSMLAAVRDQPSPWYCYAQSPTFASVSSHYDFVVELDFNPVQPDWGHYPGIYFVTAASEVAEPDQRAIAFSFHIFWSDHVLRKLSLISHGSTLFTDTITTANVRYHVTISYAARHRALSLRITLPNGRLFFDGEMTAPDEFVFNQLLIGEIQGPVKYGTESRITIDNIEVRRLRPPIEAPTNKTTPW